MHKRSLRRQAAVAAPLTLVLAAGLTAAEHPTRVHAIQTPTLTPIPREAEIIFTSPRAGTRTAEGFPVNELWVSDSEGRRLTQITRDGWPQNHFDVSPNRRRIAVMRYSHGDTNGNGRIDERDRKTLWILDLDSREEWPLLEGYDSGLGGVVWSPDGQYVYLSVMLGAMPDICRIRPDGTQFSNITKELHRSPGFKRSRWVSDVGISHDGQWLAFLYTTSRAGPSVIAVCRTDGSEARIVTDGGGSQGRHAGGEWGRGDFDPEFSPDGGRICFQRATDAALTSFNVSSHDIMISNLDGSGLARVSPPGNKAVHGICHWAEDGRIIFSEWNEQDRWVGPVITNADGVGYHRVRGAISGAWVRWLPKAK